MKYNRIYKSLTFSLSLLFTINLQSQIIESDPITPTVADAIDITFYVDQCACSLVGYTGDIYAHTGLITSESADDNDWKNVIADWNVNLPEAKLEKINSTTYTLHITPDLLMYYNIDNSVDIEKMAFVFRSTDGTKQSSNLYQTVYDPGLSVVITLPESDLVVSENDTVTIEAEAVILGTTDPDSLSLYVDDSLVYSSYTNSLSYSLPTVGSGKHWVKVVAANPDFITADSLFYFVRNDVIIAELPEGAIEGINYIDTATVTLVLHAPFKKNVIVIGDFNDWELDNNYLMNITPDSSRFWITISNLTKNQEYAYQYQVDGNLYIADPYADKILDPINDPYISDMVYPNLKPYPIGKTTGIVSVFETGQDGYSWKEFAFTPPEITDLVIYELHVRDFTEAGNFKTVIDTLDYLENLGINAVELMPVNEFEGNDSWGYNPSFYFAVDKTYGTKNDFKSLVEACHERGIAVFIDMVLNHSYSQSPLVQLYFNKNTSQTTAQNPWYNQECPHNPWCWGYDFNHESEATNAFVDRVNRYWLTEYNVDGFRFDFTKGFTNKIGDGWAYDASRIAILKDMYDSIKVVKPAAIVMFEHLSDNIEEKELANHGILLWGKMTDQYNEATMGYHEASKSNFSGISYKYRGWNDPHLVGYMESHDEQRLMFKNQTYGNSNDNYNTKELNTGLQRVEAAATFFLTVPGPKMIWEFGELGYDIDINVPCRICEKPVLWNYFDDPNRFHLYQVFSALAKLRTENDLFETTDFSLSVAGSTKTIHLNSTNINAAILGNFDLVAKNITPVFQHTGTWYEYFSGTSIEVTDINAPLTLAPGEYRLYTDVELETPDIISLGLESNPANMGDTRIFPNPAENYIQLIGINNAIVSFDLYNLSGANVLHYQGQMDEGVNQTIDFNLPKGFYIYTLKENKNLFQGKLIIR